MQNKSTKLQNRRKMKMNKWTLGLAVVGLVSLAPAVLAQTSTAAAPPPPSLLTSLSATTISGYVDTSAVWNPGTGNANPAPYAFNAGKQDGFNIDDVDIKLSKPFDSGKWSAGYVAELNYGPDGTAIDGGAAPIRQAYVDLEVPVGNGLELKLGRWDNLLGFETSDAVNDPTWTRSYAYSFEPTEHTGLLAAYQFADWMLLQVGGADTLTTTFVNARSLPGNAVVESKKTLVSLLTLTAPTNWGSFKGSALFAGFDIGQGAAVASTEELYIGTTINTPITGLSFSATWDEIQDVGLVSPGAIGYDAGYFQAFAGYATYKINDKANINARFEYADGSALSALETGNGTPGLAAYGTLDKVIAATGTFEYDLWANVMSRIEVRWDHNAGGTGPAFGGTVAGVPTKNNEVLIAANVIYKF
jgi:hypothetical protein